MRNLLVIVAVGVLLVGCQADARRKASRPLDAGAAPLLTPVDTEPSSPAEITPRDDVTPAAEPKPIVTRREIALSVLGEPIEAIRFSTSRIETRRPVLVFAGIHGSEPTSVDVARGMVALLESDASLVAALESPVVVVPLVNPDGYVERKRTNANGVDLNRNFDATNWRESPRGRFWNGPSPESEPESRAIATLLRETNPERVCSIHSIRAGRHGVNFDGPARPLARAMADANGYAVLESMGYPTPGSFGSWCGIDLQIPTITLELPSDQPGDEAWADNREAMLVFLRGGTSQ